jgi:DNA polymerase III delta prime subunit
MADFVTILSAHATGALVGPTINTAFGTIGAILRYIWNYILRKYRHLFPTFTQEMQFAWDPYAKVPDAYMLYWQQILKAVPTNTGTKGVFINGEMKFSPNVSFKYRGVDILMTFSQESINNTQGQEVRKITIANLTMWARSSKALDEINRELSAAVAKSMDRQYVSSIIKPGSGTVNMEKMLFTPQATFDSYQFEHADLIKRRLDDVMNGRMPQLGLLLSGPPGGGKTSLIHAILHYTGWSATVLNLQGCDDAALKYAIYSSTRYRGSNNSQDQHNPERHIYIMEEIDTQIDCVRLDRPALASDDKRAVFAPPKVTLTTVLNIMQGITAPTYAIFILTTNHKDVLRPEVYRDMRVHLDLEMGPLDHDRLQTMVNKKKPDWKAPAEIRSIMPAQLAKYLLMEPSAEELTEWCKAETRHSFCDSHETTNPDNKGESMSVLSQPENNTNHAEMMALFLSRLCEGCADGALLTGMLNKIYEDPTLRDMLLEGVDTMEYVEAKYGELLDKNVQMYILTDVLCYAQPNSLLLEAAFMAILHGFKKEDRDSHAYNYARETITKTKAIIPYLVAPEDSMEQMLSAYRIVYNNSIGGYDYGRIIPMVNAMFEDLPLRELILAKNKKAAVNHVKKYEPLMKKFGGECTMDWFFYDDMPPYSIYPEVCYLTILFDDYRIKLRDEVCEYSFDCLFIDEYKIHIIGGEAAELVKTCESAEIAGESAEFANSLDEYCKLARGKADRKTAEKLTTMANLLFEDERLRELILGEDEAETIEYTVEKYGNLIAERRDHNQKDWLYYAKPNSVLLECAFMAIALDGLNDGGEIEMRNRIIVDAIKWASKCLYKEDIKKCIVVPTSASPADSPIKEIIDPTTEEGMAILNDLFCDEELRSAILYADLSTFDKWEPFKETYDGTLKQLIDSGKINLSDWHYGSSPMALPETFLFLSLMTYNKYLYTEARQIVSDIRHLIKEGKLILPKKVNYLEELIERTLTFVELTQLEVDYFDENLVDEDLEYLLKNNVNDDIFKYTMEKYGDLLAPLMSYNFTEPPPSVIMPIKNKSSDYLIRLVSLVAWMPINSDNLEKFKLCCEMAKFNPMYQRADQAIAFPVGDIIPFEEYILLPQEPQLNM